MNTSPCALALGNFDGVHLAHKTLLDTAIASGLTPAVFTFDHCHPEALTDLSEKLSLFEAQGIRLCFLAPFSLFRDLSAEDFICYLKEMLCAGSLICGYNFRFGRGASGDAALLTRLSDRYGMRAYTLPAVTENGQPISSTRIRSLLKAGDVSYANRLMGHPYTVSGEVIRGYGIGTSKLTFPTLNLEAAKPIPLLHGVYITEAVIDGVCYPAITNVGNNPTIEKKALTLETHLLKASGDFYHKQVTLRFLAFLRPERAFSTPEDLRREIAENVKAAMRYHGVAE